MTLIIRMDDERSLSGSLVLGLPNHPLIAELIDYRMGERVAFGVSDTPGIWSVRAIGHLVGSGQEGAQYHVFFSDVVGLAEPVDVVTAGDPYADAAELPYVIDVLGEEDFASILASVERDYGSTTSPVLVAGEAHAALFEGGVVYGGLRLEQQRESLFNRVAEANGWTCMFTGMNLSSPDGRVREGVVIDVEERTRGENGAVTHGLFVTATIGFCYRHGLLAIGDEYEILRHRLLPAHLRILLDIVNRPAQLRLPANKAYWPDLAAARRHRRRHGF